MSDKDYKKIIDENGHDNVLNAAIVEFGNLSLVVEKFKRTKKSERMLIKSLLIEKMADAEIYLKLIKIILDMNNRIGTGVLTSMKRKKLMNRYE